MTVGRLGGSSPVWIPRQGRTDFQEVVYRLCYNPKNAPPVESAEGALDAAIRMLLKRMEEAHLAGKETKNIWATIKELVKLKRATTVIEQAAETSSRVLARV